MNECNSIEIYKTHLTDQTKFGLKKISKIENYFDKKLTKKYRAAKN